jgi:hypothetical protein
MGLDMYLSASKYIGNWDHSEKQESDCYKQIANTLGIDGVCCQDSPSMTIDVTVAYWRKANAIHRWFVNNVQDGEDNCQKAYVSREQMEELVRTCKEVISYKDRGDELKVIQAHLPPQEGFFFGSTVIDECYWEDLENTITSIEKILKNPKLNNFDFYYQASW